jgi:hypothetical protein
LLKKMDPYSVWPHRMLAEEEMMKNRCIEEDLQKKMKIQRVDVLEIGNIAAVEDNFDDAVEMDNIFFDVDHHSNNLVVEDNFAVFEDKIFVDVDHHSNNLVVEDNFAVFEDKIFVDVDHHSNNLDLGEYHKLNFHFHYKFCNSGRIHIFHQHVYYVNFLKHVQILFLCI